jgi:hypothetical protein
MRLLAAEAAHETHRSYEMKASPPATEESTKASDSITRKHEAKFGSGHQVFSKQKTFFTHSIQQNEWAYLFESRQKSLHCWAKVRKKSDKKGKSVA